ncbi:hypothetical protein, partial [Blastomonas sp. AAP53]|uniref:hypothetical protein n=1 Tax=Blastomonas sp. AAP53 TaxID=1248760 RepID=UPI00047680FA
LQNTTATAFTAAELGYAPTLAASMENMPMQTLTNFPAIESIFMPEAVSRFDHQIIFPDAAVWI